MEYIDKQKVLELVSEYQRSNKLVIDLYNLKQDIKKIDGLVIGTGTSIEKEEKKLSKYETDFIKARFLKTK